MDPALHKDNLNFSWSMKDGPFEYLTEKQITSFNSEGYLVMENAFDQDLITKVIDKIDPYEFNVTEALKGLDEGWQVVSIKYEDLKSLKNGAPSTPKGNGVYNPDKLHTLSCLFLADPKTGYSRTLMDYIIFTKDEAFKL